MENADRDRDALFGPASTAAPAVGNNNNNSTRRSYAGSDQAAPALGQIGGGGSRGFREAGGYGGSSGPAAGSYEANWQQQHQQPLSWAQVRDNIDVVERRRGLNSAYESVEVGREALERLDDQTG